MPPLFYFPFFGVTFVMFVTFATRERRAMRRKRTVLRKPKLPSPPGPANLYHLDPSERPVQEPQTLHDLYMTQAQAAKALSVDGSRMRALVKEGAVATERIGNVTLVKRRSVEMLLELARMSEDEP